MRGLLFAIGFCAFSLLIAEGVGYLLVRGRFSHPPRAVMPIRRSCWS